jgi:hypothetical protein
MVLTSTYRRESYVAKMQKQHRTHALESKEGPPVTGTVRKSSDGRPITKQILWVHVQCSTEMLTNVF